MTHTSASLVSTVGRLTHLYRLVGNLSEKRIVSKPQAISRLRYVDIVKPIDETPHERSYRLHYKKLQDWNNEYWSVNNDLFNCEKTEYIKKHFGERSNPDEALNHDLLAPFYRDFLERNSERQIDYNRIWYQQLALMLLNALKAKLSRIQVNLKNPKP